MLPIRQTSHIRCIATLTTRLIVVSVRRKDEEHCSSQDLDVNRSLRVKKAPYTERGALEAIDPIGNCMLLKHGRDDGADESPIV